MKSPTETKQLRSKGEEYLGREEMFKGMGTNNKRAPRQISCCELGSDNPGRQGHESFGTATHDFEINELS